MYDELIGALPQPEVSRGPRLPRSMVRSELSSARSLQLPRLSSSSSSPTFPTLRSSLPIHSRKTSHNNFFIRILIWDCCYQQLKLNIFVCVYIYDFFFKKFSFWKFLYGRNCFCFIFIRYYLRVWGQTKLFFFLKKKKIVFQNLRSNAEFHIIL